MFQLYSEGEITKPANSSLDLLFIDAQWDDTAASLSAGPVRNVDESKQKRLSDKMIIMKCKINSGARQLQGHGNSKAV